MLLDWLKKDLAKDVAAVKAIGAGLAHGKWSMPCAGIPLVAAATVLGVLGDVLLSPGDRMPNEETDVPFYDQGGLSHWNVRQWD